MEKREDIIKKYNLNILRVEEFDGIPIYILDRESFEKLWGMKEEKAKELQELGFNYDKAFQKAYYDEFKLLNKYKSPVKILKFTYVPEYSLVVDEEKILKKYLDKEFYKWANRQRKHLKKRAKELGLQTEKELEKLRLSIEDEIAQMEKIKDEIKNCPECFELLYTDIEKITKLYKPVVRLYDIKNDEYYHTNIRTTATNFLYETQEIPKRKPRELETLKKVKRMENIFGKIYIKEVK